MTMIGRDNIRWRRRNSFRGLRKHVPHDLRPPASTDTPYPAFLELPPASIKQARATNMHSPINLEKVNYSKWTTAHLDIDSRLFGRRNVWLRFVSSLPLRSFNMDTILLRSQGFRVWLDFFKCLDTLMYTSLIYYINVSRLCRWDTTCLQRCNS